MMDISKKRKIGWLFAFMLFAYAAMAQQYNVVGGAGVPLQAVDETRMEVYLVYGMNDVQINYTSLSTSHQWYRYKTNAFEAEEVSCVQSGTTSIITNVEEGYGYFVKEQENIAMNHFIWIVDYSKYEFDIRSLSLSQAADLCYAIRFNGDADNPAIIYYNPNGTQGVVKREFELKYETLEWNDALKSFSNKSVNQVFNSDPFATSFPVSWNDDRFLKDTEITLTGDLFARHFDVEKSISMFLEAKMIEVHADTLILSSGSSNMSDVGEAVLLGPATVKFKAVANAPVASRFVWKRYTYDETQTRIIDSVSFHTEEIDITFDRMGAYLVKLEVSNRTGLCANEEEEGEDDKYSFKINITDTEMIIPNAFSPGTTPGINDIFRVKYKSVDKFQGRIFNRWRTELFHWTDPSQGWDGKYKGKYVPPGAYYYLIEYVGTDGKSHVRKGDINVFRSKDIDTEIRTGE